MITLRDIVDHHEPGQDPDLDRAVERMAGQNSEKSGKTRKPAHPS